MDLTPVTAEQVAESHNDAQLLLLDIRPNGQFCSGHIQGAENLNFSNILLRRLLKGVVKLETMLTSPQLVERVCRRRHSTQLLLCDGGSSATHCRPELLKHAEVFVNSLRERDAKEGLQRVYSVQYLDGGYPAFTKQYPGLCVQSTATQSTSHVQISVSASLPVSLTSASQHTRKLKLQSAPADDDSDRYGPPVHILPHLVLGCAKDSSNLSVLQQMGVTAVLNVSHNCPSLFPSQLQYMEIRVPDTYQADLLSRLDDAFQFIDGVKASGGRVLVHCHAGVSRSATVCMAYVMKTLGYDLRSSYDFVKRKRSCVSPNLHFMGQLLEFERRLGVHSSSRPNVGSLPIGLSCVEEERERPCSLPPSWVSKEKRRSVSTPASLEMSPYTIPSRKPLFSPCQATPANTSSLPATPLPHYTPSPPLPGRQNHSPLTHPSPHLHSRHIAHSCSLQSLVLTPITTVAAAQNSPLPVTESL